MPSYKLTLLPGEYCVCLLPPTAPVPSWANGGDFCSITRTQDELSIICDQELLPATLPENGTEAITVARDWRLLRVEGPFAFDVTGVIAALSAPLAAAGIVILPVATYRTDYILVKNEQVEKAIAALQQEGHQVTR